RPRSWPRRRRSGAGIVSATGARVISARSLTVAGATASSDGEDHLVPRLQLDTALELRHLDRLLLHLAGSIAWARIVAARPRIVASGARTVAAGTRVISARPRVIAARASWPIARSTAGPGIVATR